MKHEQKEQIVLHKYCKHKKLISFAVPNGGSRNRLEAINMKHEGVTAGISDYVVILPHKILFIEMKRQRKKLKSGKLSTENLASKEQLAFIESLKTTIYAEGRVCYGAKEAIEFINNNVK